MLKRLSCGLGLFGVIAILLLGCGGTPAGSEADSPPPPPPSSWRMVRQADQAGGTLALLDLPRLYELSDEEIDGILEGMAYDGLSLQDRMRILLLLRVGTPYQNGCMGEGPATEGGDGTDTDPLFLISPTDCTLFVLTTTALAHARTLQEAADSTILIAQYRHPPAYSYQDRLHFTTDRLDVSPYFRDITAGIGRPEQRVAAPMVLNRNVQTGQSLLGLNGWERERTLVYIPVGELVRESETAGLWDGEGEPTAAITLSLNSGIVDQLPSVCGAALVKASWNPRGLDVVHEGVLLEHHSFVHASSLQGGVVTAPFEEFLFPEDLHGGSRYDGVVFYAFEE